MFERNQPCLTYTEAWWAQRHTNHFAILYTLYALNDWATAADLHSVCIKCNRDVIFKKWLEKA